MSIKTPERTSPQDMLSETSTSTPQPDVLSQDALHQEQLLKFLIGLRLLGEKKKQRVLAYIATLINEQRQEAKP